MLTVSLIHKYGIVATHNTYSAIDELFSNLWNDPYQRAENLAYDIAEGLFFDVSVAICDEGKCICQSVIFRTREGYEKYKQDGIVLFDQKEI